VKRADAERWGKLWTMDKPRAAEAKAMFARLGGERAAPARQKGVALILAAVADLADEEATYEDIRMRMADRADAWSNANDRPIAADEWRAVQIRQLFRLALEGLFYWTIGALLPASRSTRQLAQAFIDALDETSLADSAGEWISRRRTPQIPSNISLPAESPSRPGKASYCHCRGPCSLPPRSAEPGPPIRES
jgi:hypothetical protein